MNDYTSFFRNLAKSLLATLLCCCALHSCAQTQYHARIQGQYVDSSVIIDPVNDIATVHDWNFGSIGTYPTLVGQDGFIIDNENFPMLFEHVAGYTYVVSYIILGEVFTDTVTFEIID